MGKKLALVAAIAAFGVVSPLAHAATLDDVKSKGFLQCGVTEVTTGFSSPDSNNERAGLDVWLCRAIAA